MEKIKDISISVINICCHFRSQEYVCIHVELFDIPNICLPDVPFTPCYTHTHVQSEKPEESVFHVCVFLSRSVTLNCPGSLLSADKPPSYLIARGEDLINQLLLISQDKETKVNQSSKSKQGGVMAACNWWSHLQWQIPSERGKDKDDRLHLS